MSERKEQVIEKERRELARREQEYRGNRSPLNVEKRIVILVDDGLATGPTMRVAIKALRHTKFSTDHCCCTRRSALDLPSPQF